MLARPKRIAAMLPAGAAAATAAAIALAMAWPRAEMIASRSPADWAATPANLARGAYLARAGDCMACHTARGGAPYAGGHALDTPFGRFVTPNITPDRATGIGAWSADDFWNALHNGVAPHGRLLYPAFPYPSYTKVTRPDADALFAYLRSLAPRARANEAHALDFPYGLQPALAAWRLLYFRPGAYVPAPARGVAWNRGAYLVEGLGHCGACHSARNGLGASRAGLAGGVMASGGWTAPALTPGGEAGIGTRPDADIVRLLRTGAAPHGAVSGPMAQVVRESLQYMSEADLAAMTLYLTSLPAATAPAPAAPPPQTLMQRGATLYDKHCADCHGEDGAGVAGIYPPLAGNRAVTAPAPANALRIVLHGGFAPATAGNPRPYGMPPYGPVLDDEEIAAVVSYVRAGWGNAGRAVTAAEVNANRAVPLD